MNRQTPSASKFLARAYRSVLRRMWLKNTVFTVILTTGLMAGGNARAHEGDDPALSQPPLAEAYYTGNPDPDGSYASLYNVNPAGIFAAPTPSPVWRNLGTQRMVLFYYHSVNEANVDTAMVNGVSMRTILARNADTARAYYASASGGQFDLKFDIIDVPLTPKADGTLWTSGSAQASALPAGVSMSNYAFAGNYYSSSGAVIVSPAGSAYSSIGSPYSTGAAVQSEYNYKDSLTFLHEMGHSLGLDHSRALVSNASVPSYTYDYATKTYTATTGTGSGVIANLPIGHAIKEYPTAYSVMGSQFSSSNGLSPRQKIATGWLKPSNIANLNALNPAGGVNTVKLYDDMVDRGLVTNGGTGEALQYGVTKGYNDNVYYGAALVRPGDTFHITGSGATATGKWQAYTQTLDFYYRSNAEAYPGHEAPSTLSPGIVVTLGGSYLGVIKVGQTLLEKDFSQSLFMPLSVGSNDGNHGGTNLDDGSGIALGTSTDITSYGASSPLNPNRYRSIWYQLTYVGNGVDGEGHWANLQVQSFTGAQVYGWTWDANSGSAGSQDGAGTWMTGAGNWRSVSMALDNQNWTAGEDAVFGSGSGAAGVVTLGSNITASSIAFKATGGGNYTINGNGKTLTIDVGGVNAEVSANIAASVTLSSQQLWSVSSGAVLNVTGVITPGAAHTLYKMGQGTLALGGINTWTSQLRVTEGTVQQNANQTFNATLIIGEAGVYKVSGGTLSMASGMNIDGMAPGPRASELSSKSYGLLDLAAGGTSANPELSFANNSTVGVNTRVGAGNHYLNGSAGTVSVSGIISGTGTLIKQGASILRLTGANTFTGNMTLNAGTLVIDSLISKDGAFSVTVNAGTFALGDAFNGQTATIGSLSGTGGTINTSYDTAGGTRTLAVNQTAAGVFAGTITDASGDRTLSVAKTGAATLTLTGANTYSGGTAVTHGTLLAGSSQAFGTGTVTVGSSAGTPHLQLGNGVNVANALVMTASTGAVGRGLLEVTGTNSATWSGAIAIGGTPTAGGHFYTDSGANLTLTGPITSSVAVIQRAGNLTLSGGGSYSDYNLSGNLRLGADNGVATNATINLGVSTSGTFDLKGYDQTLVGLVKSANAATVTNTAASLSTLTINASADSAYAGVIAAGTGNIALVKSGSGNFTLSGNNTYTGGTTVSAGTLTLGSATALADTGAVAVAGGALDLGGFSETVGAVSLTGGTIRNGSLTGASYVTTAGTISANLGGTAALSKSGSGTVTLSGNNTYSGGTTLAGGFIRVADNDSALGSGALNFTGDGTLATASGGGARTLANAVTIASGATASLDGGYATLTLAGNISGSGALAKTSSGTVILTGNNTYTGGTAITGGTLQIGNGVVNGFMGTGAYAVSSGAALYLNQGASPANPLWENITGAGTLILGDASSSFVNYSRPALTAGFTGTLQVNNRGRITATPTNLGGTNRVVMNDGAQFLAFDGTTAGTAYTFAQNFSLSGLGSESGYSYGALRVSGLKATFSGNLTLTGDSGLFLQNNAGGAMNITGVIADGGAGHDLSIAARLSTGAITLSGANTYSGLTTTASNTGTLILNNTNALQNSTLSQTAGTLAFSSGVTSNAFTLGGLSGTSNIALKNNAAPPAAIALSVGKNNTSTSYSGVLSSTGSLVKVGSGTLTLSGNNTYTGGTTVTAGTLLAGHNSAFGTGAVTVNSGGTLTLGMLGAARVLTNNVVVNYGGRLAGTASLSGGVTLAAGASYLWSITGAAPSIAGTDFDRIAITAGNLTIASGATLAIAASGIDYTGSFWDSGHTFSFVTKSGTGTISGTFATLDTASAGAFSGQGAWSLLSASSGLSAVWTASSGMQGMSSSLASTQAVPEPATYGLLGAGALAAAAMVRRRRKNAPIA